MLKMKRPVVWVLSFLVLGILYGNSFGASWLIFAAVVFVCVCLYRAYGYLPVFIFAVFFVVGFFRVNESNFNHTYEVLESTVFSGSVLDVFYTTGGNRGVVIRGLHPSTGSWVRVLAYLRPFQPRPALGQEITVIGDLTPLGRAVNPGGYDQFRHLRPNKIDSFMWPTDVVLGEINISLMVLSRQMRDRLADVYDSFLPTREAGVIKAMLLGDRSDLDPELAGMYRVMGIFHILSISGLHVAILMMAVQGALGAFVPERRAAFFALLFMAFYCVMTGAAVPTVRAVLMCSVSVFGKILFRDYDLITALSWAAVLLLIYEPLYLWSVGFQLSFSAVYGIGIMKLPIERAIVKFFGSSKLNGGLAVGIAAVMSTYIVFAFHFYEINTYSLIGNLVIAPTVTLLLVLGLVMGLTGLVWMPLAGVLSGPLYFILRFYEMSAQFFYTLPFALLRTGGGNLIVASFGVLVLVSFVYWFHGFGDSFAKRRMLFLTSLMLLTVSVFFQLNPLRPQLTVLYTDGGYIVVRYRNDALIIGTAAGGERDVINYLNKRGVRQASLILTETPGPQNAGRLNVFEERIGTLYLPANATEIATSLLELALEGFDFKEVVLLGEGDVRVFGQLEIRVLELGMNVIEVEILYRGELRCNGLASTDSTQNVNINENQIFSRYIFREDKGRANKTSCLFFGKLFQNLSKSLTIRF